MPAVWASASDAISTAGTAVRPIANVDRTLRREIMGYPPQVWLPQGRIDHSLGSLRLDPDQAAPNILSPVWSEVGDDAPAAALLPLMRPLRRVRQFSRPQ